MLKQSSKRIMLLLALSMLGYISKAQTQPAASRISQGQGASAVSGTITDAATGRPVRGIRVTYQDIAAAITDSVGAFTLRVPSLQVSINVEGEGYQTKEIALRGRSRVTASLLEEGYASFYDVAALPAGTVMKSKTPYAVSTINPDGAWTSVNETPATLLQGRVAGLNAVRRSGTPNSGALLSLRGLTSLYGTNQPLIVVDGVLFDNGNYGASILGNNYTDPLSTIDPRDIDNITVLKDGSSLYGTKGANGVILITTARAKQLATKIDLTMFGGVNFAPANLPILDATDYRLYLSDVLRSRGLTNAQIQALPYMNDDKSNPEYFRYHNNTDWQRQVFDKSSSQSIYLKVTGGDNIARYGIGVGYLNNKSITRNTDLTRYNMRFNGDLNLSKRMTATTNLSFTLNQQNLRDQGVSAKTNPIFLALVKSPLLRPRDVSEAGAESPSLSDMDAFGIGNPTVLTDVAQGLNKNYRFFGNVGFNYEISKAFSVSSLIGVTNDKVRENYFIPRKGVTPDTLATDIAYSRLASGVKTLFSLFNDTRVTYNKRLSQVHSLTSRLGVRYLYAKSESDRISTNNSPIDELVSVGTGVTSSRRVAGEFGESKWLNTYFNTDYSIADKYIFSLNVAMDGSSRFGSNIPGALTLNGNKYALMPSLAAAWLLSSERFMQGNFFDLLKIRASYGLSGNDDIGNYNARQYYVAQNLLGVQGLVRAGFGNDQLQWETVKRANLGLDAAFLNERISLSLDVYRNKTDNMLAYEMAPAAAGLTSMVTNSGAMTTTGFDASFNARIIHQTSLKWDLGFTVGSYKATINQLPVQQLVTSFAGANYVSRAGSAPNQFFGYKTAGVFVSDAVAAQEGLQNRNADGSLTAFRGGDVRFVDVNGDKIIDAADRQVIGNPNPDLFGGITSRLQYKAFSLEALLTFTQGNDTYNYTRSQLEAMSDYSNQTTAVRNRWRNDGHETSVPKATWGDPMGNSRASDRWIEDGSYLRLRTVSLSYNLPFATQFVKNGTVYLAGNNLLTLTKYKGYDPEFNATESVFGRGVDNTLEPQFRSVILGLRIGL